MLPVTLTAWAAVASGAMAQGRTSSRIGPAGIMWPPHRAWSPDADNTAPCGSNAGVQNRTEFPLSNGKIAVVAQDESYDLELSISYLEDPLANGDFSQLIDMETFRTIELGHMCVGVPDAPPSLRAGANATLQIKYMADFDKPENQTFYACADITYVDLTAFRTSIPCFNASSEDETGSKSSGGGGGGSGGGAGAGSGSGSGSGGRTSSSRSGPSGGAIAGIVIGSLAGLALVAAFAVLVHRRKQQRLRLLRQQNSERGKWAADTQSQSSVRMNNL